MATRNLLHRSKLPDFLEWAKSMGAKIEPGRGSFQEYISGWSALEILYWLN